MFRSSIAAAALLGAILSVSAPAHGAGDDITRHSLERRAVEAVIWGMPAVNADLMVQEAIRHGAKANEVVYWSRPADWKNQTLTPNPDSIYFMSFWNVRVGPIVIDVPAAEGGSFAGNIVNAWQMPLEDAGPEGADQGKGGKYLLLPPGYTGNLPDADIETSVSYGKQLKIYPLASADKPQETKFTDVFGKMFDSTIPYDARFFTSLDRIVQQEPWLDRDRVMIDQLKTLGIEKGKAFDPDAATTEALDAAGAEAHALLSAEYDKGFPVINEGIRWFPAARADVVKAVQAGYADPNEYPVDARGVTYTLGFTGIKRIGTAQFYLMSSKDGDGNAFDGGSLYRLTVPADAPVKQYWSATVYDRETHALVKNIAKASVASIGAGVVKNADGSVDVFFGPKAPEGKEANWVPTDPQRKFELLFRLYGPEKPLFDKSWKLPDVVKVQ